MRTELEKIISIVTLFGINVLWAMYERSQNIGIGDQVLISLVLLFFAYKVLFEGKNHDK